MSTYGRVDPSRRVGGGDPSSGGVERPDDARLTAVVHAVARASFERGNPGASWGALEPVVRSDWLENARADLAVAYPLIIARVRAEAVADERQRIVGLILACIDRVPGVRNAGWEMGMRKAVDLIYEAAGQDASGKPLAAGSVPVATPEPDSVAELAKSCGECTEGGLGNCRHGCRERSDPTYGRIDPDIQRAVDALEPESIGSRVAMENTLQARRDAASPVPAEQPEER